MKNVIIFVSAVLFMAILPFSCDNKSDEGYNEAISKADMLFEQNKYEEASNYYSKALELKPKQKYPAQKIEEINKILDLKKVDDQYLKELKKADDFFKEKKYNEAKYAYINANKLKPDEQYPMDMIRKIDGLLMEYQTQEDTNPFNLVVGSFKVESNAIELQKELKAKGFDSRILDWDYGFSLVTFGSYPDIHKAYNNLPNAKNEVDVDVWVFYEK